MTAGSCSAVEAHADGRGVPRRPGVFARVLAVLGVAVALGLPLVGCSDRVESWLIEHTSGPRGEIVKEMASPDGAWVATMYQNDSGGATGDSWVTVYVSSVDDPEISRAVYEKETYDTEMEWEGPDILSVNGRSIDVTHETYFDIW